MTILDVENLEVEVQTKKSAWKVIRNVSFSLNEGERLGIVGESGSGKTLLARSLIKLLPSSIALSKGTVKYRGQILSAMSEHELQKIRGKEIGMVFQDPLTFLNPTLKIGAQITEGYQLHFPQATKAETAARALELLRQVGIPEPQLRLSQYPHELSGGLRQRVLIAIALAAKPHLLIADEPTTALDMTVQAQIMALLRTLQTGNSTILITHDLSLVASFCDRVIVMYAGQIVEDAPIKELFYAPKHPYTRLLLKSIPTLSNHRELETIAGAPPDLSKPIHGCPFAPRCPVASDRCQNETPPLFETVSHHKSLCWLQEADGKLC
jgi:oligopeptide transport system ATP-binding protein